MNSILKALTSLIVTFGVATLFGLIFKDNFWLVFAIATILQFFGFYIFNQVYLNNIILNAERIKIDQIKESNRNLVEIGCPCDENYKQLVDFRFDQKNIYKCDKCGKNYTAIVSFKSILTTDPIYFENR